MIYNNHDRKHKMDNCKDKIIMAINPGEKDDQSVVQKYNISNNYITKVRPNSSTKITSFSYVNTTNKGHFVKLWSKSPHSCPEKPCKNTHQPRK